MVSVYNFDSYKEFLAAWIAERPKKGRGEARKIAVALGLSSTMISQILNGDKHLTAEAASELCEYLGLAEKDADQFCLLVDFERAGTHGLRTRLKRKVKAAQADAQKLKQRLKDDRALTDAESAVYFSHWAYTGASHLIPCDPTISVEQLAERLQLPLQMMTKVMNFLLQSGLIVNRDGRLETGFKHIHLGADSPLVVKHHLNWRLRAFDRMPYSRDADLFLTAPMTLSREVADKVRSELPSFIEKIVKWVGPSESEVVRCLNIDWFDYEKR